MLPKIVPKILSYVSVFTLGLYAASQFKFAHQIELHRWVITFLCFVFFLMIEQKSKTK